MKTKKPDEKGFNVFRMCIAVVIIIVWLITIILSITKQYQIPSSVEIGFTVVLGFVFGTSTIPSIIKYWRRDK